MSQPKKKKKNCRAEADTGAVRQRLYKMCLSKVVFWSELDAKTAAQKITKEGHSMRVYNCPNCYQWHLASAVALKPKKSKHPDISAKESL